jgi:DNA-directed RNA polymerase beta' subunit
MSLFPSIVPVKGIKNIVLSVQSPEVRRLLSYVDVNDYSGIESGITKPYSLYDLRMGTVLNKVKCATCKHGVNKDCGHFGMIKLAVPIFNILYLDHIKNVLVSTCFKCGTFLIRPGPLMNRILKYPKELRMNYVKHYAVSKKYSKCPVCNFVNDITYRIMKGFDIQFKRKSVEQQKFESINPTVVLSNFKNLRNKDIEVMGFDTMRSRPEWFILEEILVPGTPIRPSIISNEGNQRSESNIYKHLSGIVKANNKLMKELETRTIFEDKVYKFYEALCFSVASLFTDKISKKSIGGIMSLGSGKLIASIKEMYKDKSGLIRGHLAGKRVDYSSRSVISSESMFMIDELGVPEYICRNLTITEIVNMYNIERLKCAVMVGKRRYPGATRVVKAGNGKERYIFLVGDDKKLKGVADNLKYGDIVYRHLVNGDPVIFNRQPSLHKLSIMGFYVHVVHGHDSFRLNNSATGPFNADYDGCVQQAPIIACN